VGTRLSNDTHPDRGEGKGLPYVGRISTATDRGARRPEQREDGACAQPQAGKRCSTEARGPPGGATDATRAVPLGTGDLPRS